MGIGDVGAVERLFASRISPVQDYFKDDSFWQFHYSCMEMNLIEFLFFTWDALRSKVFVATNCLLGTSFGAAVSKQHKLARGGAARHPPSATAAL